MHQDATCFCHSQHTSVHDISRLSVQWQIRLACIFYHVWRDVWYRFITCGCIISFVYVEGEGLTHIYDIYMYMFICIVYILYTVCVCTILFDSLLLCSSKAGSGRGSLFGRGLYFAEPCSDLVRWSLKLGQILDATYILYINVHVVHGYSHHRGMLCPNVYAKESCLKADEYAKKDQKEWLDHPLNCMCPPLKHFSA